MEISNCGGGGIYFVAEMFCIFSPIFFFNRIADSDLFHNIFREMCLKRHMNILSSLCCLVFTNLSLVSISFFLTDYFHFRMLTKLTMLTILGLMVPGWYYECNGFAIGLRPMEFRFWPSCQIDFVDQQSQLHCRSTHLSFHSPVVQQVQHTQLSFGQTCLDTSFRG